jgi:hypothetical protein
MIDPRRAFTYFTRHFSLKASSSNWHTFNCPFCDKARDKKKCAVRFDWERVKCWECGYSNSISYFVADIEDTSLILANQLVNAYEPTDISFQAIDLGGSGKYVVKEDIALPTGFTPILEGEGVIGKRARAYLTKRGFDLKVLDRLGFGYCNDHNEDFAQDYFGYIVIPFRSKGQLIYYIGRDFMGNELRYKNPKKDLFGVGKNDLFYNEDALHIENVVFITEGWADAQTIGDNAVSTQGWDLSDRQAGILLKSSCQNLVFVPDLGEERGETFYKKALKAALPFANHKKVFVLDTSPLAPYGKDVNDYGKDRLMEIFYKSSALTHGALMLKLLR